MPPFDMKISVSAKKFVPLHQKSKNERNMDAFWTPFLVITPIYIFYYVAMILYDLKAKPNEESDNANIERFDPIEDKPDDSIPDDNPIIVSDDEDETEETGNSPDVPPKENQEKAKPDNEMQADNPVDETNTKESTSDKVNEENTDDAYNAQADEPPANEDITRDLVAYYSAQAAVAAIGSSHGMFDEELNKLMLDSGNNTIVKETISDTKENK